MRYVDFESEDRLWDVVSLRYGESFIQQVRSETDTIRGARRHARILFFDALYEMAPQISDELISLALDMEHYQVDLDCVHALPDWQHRHNLTDAWIRDAALTTLRVVMLTGYPHTPLYMPWEDLQATSLEGKVWSELQAQGIEGKRTDATGTGTCVYAKHELVHIPVDIDDLRLPPREAIDGHGSETTTANDAGALGTFNPRWETIDDAVKRLMPELEMRLRRALSEIVSRDRSLPGVIPPVMFRKRVAFERLVRFQVLGESRNGIAKKDGVSRATVTEQVNDTARLIGLTLREDRVGRPRRVKRPGEHAG